MTPNVVTAGRDPRGAGTPGETFACDDEDFDQEHERSGFRCSYFEMTTAGELGDMGHFFQSGWKTWMRTKWRVWNWLFPGLRVESKRSLLGEHSSPLFLKVW